MKDGQIINGAIISENKKFITVKTKYQNREIFRDHILRILYGNRELEKINILLKNGSLLTGYLVDQDADRVIFRNDKDSIEEVTIIKNDIKQMSREEIKQFNPDLFFNIGVFKPLDAGSTRLDYAPIFTIGSSLNFTWVKNMKIIFEAGYSKSKSESNSGQYLQIIPFTVSAAYSFNFSQISIIPKIGIGIAIIDFDDGESEKTRGYNYDALAGVGLVYELIKQSFSFNLWSEYNVLIEEDEILNCIILKAGISYRF